VPIVEITATTGYSRPDEWPGETPRTRRDDDGDGEPWKHAQGERIVSSPADEFDYSDYDTPNARGANPVALQAVQAPPPLTLDYSLQEFESSDRQLVLLAARAAEAVALPVTNPKGYGQRERFARDVRQFWVAVEKRRKELKADSLAYGRQVDAVARKLDTAARAIVADMQAEMKAVDDAEAAKKREAEEAAQRAVEEAERTRLAKIDADHQAALAAEREKNRAETERLTLERIAQARERAEIDAARRALDDMRRANEQAEADRQTAIRVERETRERIEREQIEAAERQRRLEAMQPDAAKLRNYAVGIRRVVAAAPTMDTRQARDMLDATRQELERIADDLDGFGGGISPPAAAHDAKRHTLDDL
jgi:hypothetical protein